MILLKNKTKNPRMLGINVRMLFVFLLKKDYIGATYKMISNIFQL